MDWAEHNERMGLESVTGDPPWREFFLDVAVVLAELTARAQ